MRCGLVWGWRGLRGIGVFLGFSRGSLAVSSRVFITSFIRCRRLFLGLLRGLVFRLFFGASRSFCFSCGIYACLFSIVISFNCLKNRYFRINHRIIYAWIALFLCFLLSFAINDYDFNFILIFF
jgi:hypothetical protein